jgi:SAM-dependent methyltransferase
LCALKVDFESFENHEAGSEMSWRASVSQAQIDAGNAYENLFVKALFAEWVPKMIEAARVRQGQRVLDLACGTGVLAHEAALRVGAKGSVVGLDANSGMLAVATSIAPTVEWRHGIAESLPFADESFDAVVCQFGLMFFSDKVRALREMLRVLKPKGRLAVAVWDSIERMPAYADEVALLERLAGQEAADALRAPFVLGDREHLEMLFADSGAGSVVLNTQHGTARFPSIRTMVEADQRGWLPVMRVTLTEDQISQILQEAETALRPYVKKGGKVTFQTSATIASTMKS